MRKRLFSTSSLCVVIALALIGLIVAAAVIAHHLGELLRRNCEVWSVFAFLAKSRDRLLFLSRQSVDAGRALFFAFKWESSPAAR